MNICITCSKPMEESDDLFANAECDECHVGMDYRNIVDKEKIDKLQESNRIMREALEYYANGNGGDEEEDSSFMPATLDFPFSGTQLGKLAREALKKVGEV